jgi:homoserine dehydrogenase
MARTSALRSVWPARPAPARVGLVGFGTVGRSVARILESRADERLRLARICVRNAARPRPAWLHAEVDWTARFDDLLAPDIDIVVELVGGLSPAREWVTRALLAHKSVVTANKQLVAEEGGRLAALASRQRRQLRYGASVAGGVPVIDAIRQGLSGDRLRRITGVLNGTCNYVLTRIEEAGVAFEDALAEAQARGYAEADPSADIDGLDARAKLAILCRVGLEHSVRPADIPCTSIACVTARAFAAAHAEGKTIRQVSRAEIVGVPGSSDTRVTASVGPELLPRDSILARVSGCENAVVVTGEFGGDTVYAGRGAGGDATGVAVISDLLAIAGTQTGGIR